MKFSKKTAHRVIVSLAMLAPVLYLFGVMVFGLNGANGFETNAQYEVVKSVDVKQISPLSSQTYSGTGTGDPNNLYILFPSVVPASDFENHFYWFSGRMNVSIGEIPRFRVRYPYLSELWTSSDSIYFSECTMVSPGVNGFTFQVLAYSSFEVSFDNLQVVDLTYTFPDMSNQERQAFVNQYFGNDLFPQGISSFSYSVSMEGTTIEGYSSSFFPKDNFIEGMGANALSSSPVGFAPFASFLGYLDANVFHAANSQIALMLYGMVYWSLHVIIADLVYHVAVFIPNIIQRVFDWFGQKGLDDD